MTKTVIINNVSYPVYADVTDSNNYNNAIYGSTWGTLKESEKSQFLVMATRKIDGYNYTGQKQSDEQPLKFPRVMRNGTVSDDDTLIDLCCQVASYYYDNGTSGDSGDFLNNVKDYQVGDLKVSFKTNADIELSGLDDLIQQALQAWLLNQGMEIWL